MERNCFLDTKMSQFKKMKPLYCIWYNRDIIFLFDPFEILRADTKKYIFLVFGSNEYKTICFWNLLTFSIDLNARDNFGMTAFHLACWWGKVNTVEILISNAEMFKLDLKAKTKLGKTGLDLATVEGKTGVISVIKSKRLLCVLDFWHSLVFPSLKFWKCK